MEIPFSRYFAQGNEFHVLYKQLQERSLVHACLITGEKGLGKKTLAFLMAETLLCSGEGNRPCGRCKSCSYSRPQDNPDLITIQRSTPLAPDGRKDRASIPVDDIREMIRLCGQHTVDGNAHVVLLLEADKMTVPAQNCLLKTLEEPPEDTYIFLVTEHPEILLPTIISRCRTIRLKPWSREVIHDVLLKRNGAASDRLQEAALLADGSIGTAISLMEDEDYWKQREEIIRQFFQTGSRSEIIRISAHWKDRKNDADTLISVLESVIHMMLQHRYHPEKTPVPAFLPAGWQKYSETASEARFSLLLDTIRDAKRQMLSSVNFQAVIEKILFVLMGENVQ